MGSEYDFIPEFLESWTTINENCDEKGESDRVIERQVAYNLVSLQDFTGTELMLKENTVHWMWTLTPTENQV